jgi:hypothetical protein
VDRRVNALGYVETKVPGHPNARMDGTILEHRLVMSRKLGRPLQPGENVHHIDGDRTNNAPENLELWIVRQPAGQRARDLLRAAIIRDEHVEYGEGECAFA